MSLDELRLEFSEASNAVDAAQKARDKAEQAYVLAKADSVGVKIGSVVTTTQEGNAPKVRVVTRRYRVCGIEYCRYRAHELKLYGVTIRKDGSDGERHDIWQDWKLEASA